MMELGVLSDMLDIKKKALKKLFEQQVEKLHFRTRLFSIHFPFLPTSLFLIHLLSPSLFRVPIESSFYRRTRKW